MATLDLEDRGLESASVNDVKNERISAGESVSMLAKLADKTRKECNKRDEVRKNRMIRDRRKR